MHIVPLQLHCPISFNGSVIKCTVFPSWYLIQDWEMLAFLQALKGIVRASNSVAVITFPASLLRPTMAIRWQHFANILLSVETVLG